MGRTNKELRAMEKLKKEQEKIEKKEKRREVFIVILAGVSIIGAFVSLFFLAGMTGAVLGATRNNLYGLIFIIVSLLVWSIVVLLYSRGNREKKELDIKKLVREA